MYTFEIAATRRQSSWWSLMGSFTEIWGRSQALGAGASYTPNSLINTYDGVNKSTAWQAKVTGTLNLPWGLAVSPVFRLQAGQPYARTFTQALNYGTATILAETTDARRKPNITIFAGAQRRSWTN